MHIKNYISLDVGDGGSIIKPNLSLICQIEDELGSIPNLLEMFKTDRWKISHVVTMIHIMLAEAGFSYDYCELGNRIIKNGVSFYHKKLSEFMELAIIGKTI